MFLQTLSSSFIRKYLIFLRPLLEGKLKRFIIEATIYTPMCGFRNINGNMSQKAKRLVSKHYLEANYYYQFINNIWNLLK